MNILVRLPTWIGDTIMATPFLESLKNLHQDACFTFVGSHASIELITRNFPHARFYVDDSKQSHFRILSLYRLAKKIGYHDMAFTLQNNFLSAWLLYMTHSKQRIGYAKECRSFLLTHSFKPPKHAHQVERYMKLLDPQQEAKTLFLAHEHKEAFFPHLKQIGINTGGAFGSAKRWGEQHFQEAIQALLQQGYGVILLGGQEDIQTNADIVKDFHDHQNLKNLTGQTTLKDLIDTIATLDLLITNDSGPMHIAAALKIPIIAIFGSTDLTETSPWMAKATLLSKNLPCSPCKKRICPLKHHACMQDIKPQEVLEAVKHQLSTSLIS